MSLGPRAVAGAPHSRLVIAIVFGAAALGVVALHLATSATLGFHTDELYYLACGRHPALGYVDVAYRLRPQGTHLGDFAGLPATGKRIEYQGFDSTDSRAERSSNTMPPATS